MAVLDGSPRTVRAEGPDGEKATDALTLPEDLAAAAHAFHQGMSGRAASRSSREVRRPTEPPQVDQEALGELLFRAIFPERLYGIYSVWMSGGGRLRLRLEVDLSLAWIPWELLRDPHQNTWLALTNGVSLVREAASLQPWEPAIISGGGLSVLAVGASPLDLPELGIERERALLEEALSGTGRVTWAPGSAARVVEILDDRRANHHIFHFAGHGSFDDSGGALYWGEGPSKRLSADKLSALLARHGSIRLAVLNVCEGATSSKDSPAPSIANALVRGGVPAVLAMQAPILDAAALEATRTFYRSLARGVPIEDAVTDLRRALAAQEYDWAAPVLTLAHADRPLFVRRSPVLTRAARWLRDTLRRSAGALLIGVLLTVVAAAISRFQGCGTGDDGTTGASRSDVTTTTDSDATNTPRSQTATTTDSDAATTSAATTSTTTTSTTTTSTTTTTTPTRTRQPTCRWEEGFWVCR